MGLPRCHPIMCRGRSVFPCCNFLFFFSVRFSVLRVSRGVLTCGGIFVFAASDSVSALTSLSPECCQPLVVSQPSEIFLVRGMMTGFRWECAQLRILPCAAGLIQPAGLACFFGHHGEGVRPLLPADAQGPRLAPADTLVGRPLVVAGGGGDHPTWPPRIRGGRGLTCWRWGGVLTLCRPSSDLVH